MHGMNSENRAVINTFIPLELCSWEQPTNFWLGDTCGVHHAESNCNGADAIGAFKSKLYEFRQFLFPPELSPNIRQMSEAKAPRKLKPNGGWADERDLLLCQHFQRNTRNGPIISKSLLDLDFYHGSSHSSLMELRSKIISEMSAYMGPA